MYHVSCLLRLIVNALPDQNDPPNARLVLQARVGHTSQIQARCGYGSGGRRRCSPIGLAGRPRSRQRDVNAGRPGRALNTARIFGHNKITQLLLENGAIEEPPDVESGDNIEDEEGDTEEQGGEVDGSAGAEEHEHSKNDRSEEERASAEEHPDGSNEDYIECTII